MKGRADAHRDAADHHDRAVERHQEAAQLWDEQGKPEQADLERRNVAIERAAAALERDRAEAAEAEDVSGQIRTAVHRADSAGEARVPCAVALPGVAEEEARRYVDEWWDVQPHPFTYERDQGGLTIRKIEDPETGFR